MTTGSGGGGRGRSGRSGSRSRGGSSCFPAGTPVTLANGDTVPIESLQPGHHVTKAGGLVNAVLKLQMSTTGIDSVLYRYCDCPAHTSNSKSRPHSNACP